MSEGRADRAEEQAERLRELGTRHARLLERRLNGEAELRQAQREEVRLRQGAEQKYGTSDPAELRRMHDEALRENDERLAAFDEQLDGVEAELARFEETDGAAR